MQGVALTKGRYENMSDQFNQISGDESPEKRDSYVENAPLEDAFEAMQSETDENKRMKALLNFLNVMASCIAKDAMVPTPFIDVNNAMFTGLDIENAKVGDVVQLKEDVHLRMDAVRDSEDNEWLPLLLSDGEQYKSQTANIIVSMPIIDILRFGLQWESVKGVVVNPFGGRPFAMGKDLLKLFLQDYDAWLRNNKTNGEDRPQS